ncbi:hypothetical protein [Flammeovirga kamogawensis]|uniref:Auto-transporter adhesin head GIN domain-containing protein n=1 Tax=Flammeovirga kamogawensis TaxID=373891 RepID=A0ABX8H5F0_9BACT|nr:hypothetical protein [Flammeovirga kamogawensis]MBB6461745.1 hypothetical protein [Flammeovirga kamogawensis]QWG10662.1 hypothetical protein KM029_25095 [Flammeovirga kamogawensis]TRX63766.1 hypothetical protein EO216_25475 [Flammeovirga kamogawensis]
MKKSNIYLLSILCSVTLFIISGALVSIARGKKSTNENTSLSSVPAYSHIVLENTNYIIIVKTAEKFEMKLSLKSNTENFTIPFDIKGDTLYLTNIPSNQKDKIKFVELTIPIDDLAIEAHNSRVDLDNYLGKSLQIELDQAELNIFNARKKGFSSIDIQCINGSRFYSISQCENLQLDVRASEFENWKEVKIIKGSVKDKSSVMINRPGETNLEKDKDSKVQYFYN